METHSRTLEAEILSLLGTGGVFTTGAIIAALPNAEGWAVRKHLDALADAGHLHRARGRQAHSRVWSTQPIPSRSRRARATPAVQAEVTHEKV